ncbi:hypothetical protein BCR34DRAFT_667443 [Clohesyomyces aquaticus]|uniref:Uncharacterized protein n=1 Tax=Clohesyomyces aquaticus TaxID=1231657 RepID=A0A1Y1YZ33_9PLEO|nr:hypothetical protein BCR34DRAFT_667443 [Clohesyomyces aquaticus]
MPTVESLIGPLQDLRVTSCEEPSTVRFKDATETYDQWNQIKLPAPRKWVYNVYNGCADGRSWEVWLYLQISSERHFLIKGVDLEGNTALIRAASGTDAMLSNTEVLKLLIEAGVDMNARNKRRRTALMEAALWGRLEHVKLMLRKGAIGQLQDDCGDRAADLARPLEKYGLERFKRSRRNKHVERPYFDNRERCKIAELLGGLLDIAPSGSQVASVNPFPTDDRIPSEEKLHHTQVGHYPVKLWERRLVQKFRLAKSDKAIAYLYRGDQYPPIYAMSGYSHPSCSISKYIAGSWAKEAQRISQ